MYAEYAPFAVAPYVPRVRLLAANIAALDAVGDAAVRAVAALTGAVAVDDAMNDDASDSLRASGGVAVRS